MDKVQYMYEPLLWAYVFNKPTVPYQAIYNAYVHHYKATGTPTCTIKGTDFE